MLFLILLGVYVFGLVLSGFGSYFGIRLMKQLPVGLLVLIPAVIGGAIYFIAQISLIVIACLGQFVLIIGMTLLGLLVVSMALIFECVEEFTSK